ncbi:PTS system ascorbate-specific IIA component [Enterococcus sp. PF1-24]|uniref:PTS sugar transporter subunit IIA n=1 Tax=unclassified Enterococcus TaxID=2608891 RepID=UPI002476B976|nr:MULTISPECIES: PTS sugar transporter subunit IIA [unclassified Enterococcus]MDH6363938.1 PTS system ascorbate-specific IIA component [Enterococcus sp. PFB1-1]MDH6401039.1 PTS system ascorbate-specific IIA component [Enterococcus sp. PF1-24]
MLKYFLENDLVRFSKKQPRDWQEAIQMSCENMLEKEMISQVYVDEIIECVGKYGPYIVIIPGVAMPHSSEQSQGVFGTGISFTKMPEDVVFEAGNPEKNAKLFFVLAAKNGDEHVQNIANLSEMLMTDGLVEDLSVIHSFEEYQGLVEKYNI